MNKSIVVLSDVKDLAELLDGAGVEQANVVPAGGRLELVIEGTRAMVEQPPVVRGGVFKRAKTPWTKYRLTLTHITRVTVTRAEHSSADHAPLLACDAVPGGYELTVQAPDGLRLVVGLEQLEGTFADIGSVVQVP